MTVRQGTGEVVNYRLCVFSALCLMPGIFVGALVCEDVTLSVTLPIACSAAGVLLYSIFKKPSVVLFALIFSAGIAGFCLDFRLDYAGDLSGEKSLSARVEEEAENYYLVEELTFDGKDFSGKALLRKNDATKCYRLKRGDAVSLAGDVSTIKRDFFGYAYPYCNRIYYEITPVEIYGASFKGLKFFEKIKDRMISPMSDFADEDETGIAAALMFGDKSLLLREDAEMIRGIGMGHVFAVSGLHVGFMLAIILFVSKRLKLTPKSTFITAFFILFGYGFLTGFPAGVKRASIMALCIMCAPFFLRKSDALTSLAFACIIVLATNPRELFDLGFAMSFGAVLGIIMFYSPFYRFFTRKFKNEVWRYVASGVSLTLSANVFLIPICFNVFNTFALYMVLSNLVMLPLVGLAYSLLMITGILSLIYSGFGYLYAVVRYPVTAIKLIGELIYSFPSAIVETEPMGCAAIFYVAAAVVMSRFVKLGYGKKFLICSLLSAAGITVFLFLRL